MPISVGDSVPDVTVVRMTEKGPEKVQTSDLFAGRTVALFALPGAFTPTCSAQHVPSFKKNAEALKEKGVDHIACLSVNDAFVMGAWGKDQGTGDTVNMIGDGNADFTKAVGLEFDGTGFGMGTRSQRYSMIVKDGVISELNIEKPGAYEVSSAEYMLKQL